MVNKVSFVTSPKSLPNLSKPLAVKACVPPAITDTDPGVSARCSKPAGVTVSVAVPLGGPSLAVTVRLPVLVAEHTAPMQDPSAIVNVAALVTSPRSLPNTSRP